MSVSKHRMYFDISSSGLFVHLLLSQRLFNSVVLLPSTISSSHDENTNTRGERILKD